MHSNTGLKHSLAWDKSMNYDDYVMRSCQTSAYMSYHVYTLYIYMDKEIHRMHVLRTYLNNK